MTNGNHQVTLDDLGEVRTEAKLVRPDGRLLLVPVRSLSEQEVWQMRQAMKWPEPPLGEPGRWDGPDKPVTRKPQWDDKGYQQSVSAANRQFSRRLMARTLLVEIPGDSDDERAAALESKLGAWAASQLQAELNRLLGISETEISATADNFQQASDSDT